MQTTIEKVLAKYSGENANGVVLFTCKGHEFAFTGEITYARDGKELLGRGRKGKSLKSVDAFVDFITG
jgi:hypothetical protein